LNSENQSAVIRYWDSVAANYLALFRDELGSKSFDQSLLCDFAGFLEPGACVCDVAYYLLHYLPQRIWPELFA